MIFKKMRLLFIVSAAAGLAVLLLFFLQPVKIKVELSDKAPLSALAEIKTREAATVEVTIKGRDNNDITVLFDKGSEFHKIPVLGLYPDYKNQVVFAITTESGRSYTRGKTIQTDALPDYYPEIKIERHLPGLIEPGVIFMHLGHYDDDGDFHALPSAVDNYGRVRWFYKEHIGHSLRRLENGNFLIHRDNSLIEMDMLGNESALSWTVDTGIHHDALELPDGNLLALSTAPGSYEDGLVEIDRESGNHVRYWDFRKILDQQRPRQPLNLEESDWLHLNGMDYDAEGDTIVLSGRDQSAVVGVGREDGKLKWIIGSHEHWKQRFSPYLLTPRGHPFEWAWGQHAPMFHPEDPERVLIYDNGNKRSYDSPLEPEDNYSRAVEYEINTEKMEIRQLWEYGRRYGSERYTPFIGDADYLPGGNRLVCFGGITRNLQGEPMEIFDFENESINRMKISAVIAEVTGDLPAREVLTILLEDSDSSRYRGYRSYRAVKMPLYPGAFTRNRGSR